MTEEIIIDGVNVAGCVQLQKELTYPCGLGGTCEGWDNCYYKQLKRLKQENSILAYNLHLKEQENENEKKVYNECMYYLACMTEQRNKLKLALEEIRNCINTYPSVENDFENSETYLRIMQELEVLNEN